MIRDHLFGTKAPADVWFRWRGDAPSRIEALSDGVFALTLTLLVVSVDVPTTFYELWIAISDLPIFLVTFASIIMAWHYHYIFFRRYGLEDFATSMLNTVFLFLVMFYAYPLKFLATFLWRLIQGQGSAEMFRVPEGIEWMSSMSQRAGMMYFYGAGVVGVFGVMALMTWRAYRLRAVLELDEIELVLTRGSMVSHSISVAVALLSIAVMATTRNPGLSGICYFLMGPVHAFWGFSVARRAETLAMSLVDQSPDAGAA